MKLMLEDEGDDDGRPPTDVLKDADELDFDLVVVVGFKEGYGPWIISSDYDMDVIISKLNQALFTVLSHAQGGDDDREED